VPAILQLAPRQRPIQQSDLLSSGSFAFVLISLIVYPGGYLREGYLGMEEVTVTALAEWHWSLTNEWTSPSARHGGLNEK
jgi:hypothetical protein